LDLVLNQSLKAFGDFKLLAYDHYMKLAKDKEEVSGEILDRLQVQAKIQSLIDSNLDQDVKAQKSLSKYTKLTSSTIQGNICRPILDESLIPKTLDEAIEIALQTNNKVKAQYELIQEQKAKISLAESKFYPDLKLQLSAEWDNDLAIPNNGQQEKYKATLVSNWSIYKGGKDSLALEKEKVNMLKERKVLDSIKNDVIDEITGTYKTYFQLKKRLENLKKYVDTNHKIVEVYREQLKEGSRTFMDLLSAETEEFRTRIMLETEDINRYKEYFNILKNLNKLSDTVLAQKNQICKKFDMNTILPNYDKQYKNNEATLEEDLELETKELGLEE
jgi:adhesin transport system outer membrane protein